MNEKSQTDRKHVTNLSQVEKYNLMTWLDNHRAESMAKTDHELADIVREEYDIPHITVSHVAGARRALGMKKTHASHRGFVDDHERINRSMDALYATLSAFLRHIKMGGEFRAELLEARNTLIGDKDGQP